MNYGVNVKVDTSDWKLRKPPISKKRNMQSLINAIGWSILMKKRKSELAESLNALYDCIAFPDGKKITHAGIKYSESKKVEEIFTRLGLW